MDPTVALLTGFAQDLRYEDLDPEVVRCVRRVALDSLGCAVAGHHTPPAPVARLIPGA